MLEIPGYTLLRILGQGGMGVVYLAVQNSLGREMALKVLTPVVALDAAATETIRREAQIAASLHHPHIVAVYDVGIHNGMPYMAMEYLPGGTVAEMTWGADQIPIALRVVRDIALALDFAHSKGVVHRDIKPENILRHVDGSFMLSDFGIARAAQVSGLTTVEGLISGTPHYMSPEQWRGEKLDGRADLYSLGVVLYRMLTGRLPFQAGDTFALGLMHTTAEAPRLPPASAHIQPLLDDLLAKDRTQRVQTGQEVARRAEALLADHKAETDRTKALPRRPGALPASTARRRRTVALLLGALALVVLLALLGRYAWIGHKAVTNETAGPPAASIAVLPFTARSQAPDDVYFADGLADELQDALSGVPGLMVAARNSAYAASQKTLDVKALGIALNVATVLNATVRRDGSHVRISAQLSDTRTGFGVWSASYDRELTDIFAVQHEIAQQAVHALLGALPGAEKPLKQRLAVTGNVYAYDAYLRGMQLLHRSSRDRTLDAAIAQFTAALAADKKFARAQAGICTAEINRHEVARDAQAMARARDACERAQAMDGELREVNLALGEMFRSQGDRAKATENYTKALDNPALRAEAYLGMARLEWSAKHDDLAEHYFELSRGLDSGNWSLFLALGNFRAAHGQSAEAIEAYRTAISLAPDDAVSPWNNLGALYLTLDDYQHAAEAFNRSVAIDPNHSALSNLGTVRFALGDYAGAAEMYRRATELAPGDHRTWGNLADALSAQTGHDEAARAAYDKAAQSGEVWLALHSEDAESIAELAWFHANLGDAARARSEIEKAEALPTTAKGDVAMYAAQAYARLGDEPAARERIARARAAGMTERQLAVLPVLKPLLAKGGGLG